MKTQLRRSAANSGIAALFLLIMTAAPATAGLLDKWFAPKAVLWERWDAHDPDSSLRVDHTAWDRLLETYVAEGADGINRVAYAGIKEDARQRLAAYIATLANTPIGRYNRAQQRAFWINLYNALTVKVVLDHYPVKSIRDIDISTGLFANGPWRKKLVEIEAEALSLDDIEHRILRPIWRDPRIHYAVNCAAIGCPNLQRAAFTAQNTESMLEAGARAYINHPRGVRSEVNRLIVSSIYVWFEADFETDGGVIKHFKRYAAAPLAAILDAEARVSGNEYDWTLNDAGAPRSQ